MTVYLIINILSITNFYDHYTQFSIIDLIKNAIVASTGSIDFVGVSELSDACLIGILS